MAQTLVDQLVEVMPELQGISAWHAIGKRRRLDELGIAAMRTFSEDVFITLPSIERNPNPLTVVDPTAVPRSHPRSHRLAAGKSHRWLVFVLPMAVYMLIGSIEPSPGEPGGKLLGLAIPYSAYPLLYTAKIALTLAAMALVLPGYRQFRRPPGLLAVLVGAVGIVVWVGLWNLSSLVGTDAVARPLPGYGPRPASIPWRSSPPRPPGHGPSWRSASSAWWW